MPRNRVSDDLRARIPVLHREGYPVKHISHLLGIKKSLVCKVLYFYRRFGVTSNPFNYSSHVRRRRSLSQGDLVFLDNAVVHRGSICLDDMQDELWIKRRVDASRLTIFRALQQLGVSHKVVSARAQGRYEELRALYMNRIADQAPDANMLMFIGEAAKDGGLQYSIVPVITLDGIIAYDIVEGPVDTERFAKFLQEQVMPFTNPYPGPRSVLVMDNCHGEQIRRLVEDEHLCKVIYLPPHSPNYNPIEQAISTIKPHLHHHCSMMSIVRACQSITPDKAEVFFRTSGYIAFDKEEIVTCVDEGLTGCTSVYTNVRDPTQQPL